MSTNVTLLNSGFPAAYPFPLTTAKFDFTMQPSPDNLILTSVQLYLRKSGTDAKDIRIEIYQGGIETPNASKKLEWQLKIPAGTKTSWVTLDLTKTPEVPLTEPGAYTMLITRTDSGAKEDLSLYWRQQCSDNSQADSANLAKDAIASDYPQTSADNTSILHEGAVETVAALQPAFPLVRLQGKTTPIPPVIIPATGLSSGTIFGIIMAVIAAILLVVLVYFIITNQKFREKLQGYMKRKPATVTAVPASSLVPISSPVPGGTLSPRPPPPAAKGRPVLPPRPPPPAAKYTSE